MFCTPFGTSSSPSSLAGPPGFTQRDRVLFESRAQVPRRRRIGPLWESCLWGPIAPLPGKEEHPMPTSDDLANATVAELATRIRERQLSPVEVVEAAIDRI